MEAVGGAGAVDGEGCCCWLGLGVGFDLLRAPFGVSNTGTGCGGLAGGDLDLTLADDEFSGESGETGFSASFWVGASGSGGLDPSDV